MRVALLTLLLATPALADPIPGADDPAFRAPFERALQGDDPTALTDLHAAAEAGNTAAVLALPAVSDWLRAKLPFSERKKLGRVNGTPIAEAYAAADPTAALWALGEPGTDMNALLNRAFGLYDAGEPDKATLLFSTWVNQTGGYETLPPGFFDRPVPPWLIAFVLRGRLIDSGYGTREEGDAIVIDRLKANDPAAWIAVAGFAGLHRSDPPPAEAARLPAIFQAAALRRTRPSVAWQRCFLPSERSIAQNPSSTPKPPRPQPPSFTMSPSSNPSSASVPPPAPRPKTNAPQPTSPLSVTPSVAQPSPSPSPRSSRPRISSPPPAAASSCSAPPKVNSATHLPPPPPSPPPARLTPASPTPSSPPSPDRPLASPRLPRRQPPATPGKMSRGTHV